MRKGELSNEVLPKVYVVFEDLIGSLTTPKDRLSFQVLMKRRKWEEAVNLFDISLYSKQSLVNIHWIHNFRVDVVTFLDKNLVPAIRGVLDKRSLLFGDVLYYKVPELSASLTMDPSILAVLDPDPARYLTWGGRGRYCTRNHLDYMKLL